MNMTQPQAGTAPQAASPAPSGESFRDRMLAKLAAENPLPTPAENAPKSPVPEPEDEETALANQQLAEASEDTAETDEVDGDEITQLRAQIDRLSQREKELTADYTRKTQRIAEVRRQVESDAETVRNTARFVASVIDAPIRQYQAVPWAELQTQDPAKYQTLRGQYEQAMGARNQFLQQIAAAEAAQEEALEANRVRQAELSKDILKAQIPGYSNELYQELRQYAADSIGYEPAEFDMNTDYRLVLALHRAYRAERAANTVKSIKREQKKAPPNAQNKPQMRSVSGQFANARQALSENRGNRDIARQMFQQKLAADRK